MNDEIKEILKSLQADIENNTLIEVRGNYFKSLLDYITNLQQENEVLENEKDMFYKVSQERLNKWLLLNDENNKLVEIIKDYKSRIEKTVEYIENCPEYLWENVNTKELLNILNGRSDE